MAEGAEKLRRQGEGFVLRRMRNQAKEYRKQTEKAYHAEPEIISTYLSMAWFLEDAANTLAEIYKERRTKEEETDVGTEEN